MPMCFWNLRINEVILQSQPTKLIWESAGFPIYPSTSQGTCRSCGSESQGINFDTWVRDTFTDHDKLLPGTVICEACQFCFSDQNTILSSVLNKSTPQRMRNYSHFVVGGKWKPLSKADKKTMLAFLLSGPDVAVIADSGQKHIIFRSRPGWWQFEEMAIRPFPEELQRIVGIIAPLCREVFSKNEVETGRYIPSRILRFGMEEWEMAENQLKLLRGSREFKLALFLVQKEEANGPSKDRGQSSDAGVEGNSGELQGSLRPKHLGAIREPDQKRGIHGQSGKLF